MGDSGQNTLTQHIMERKLSSAMTIEEHVGRHKMKYFSVMMTIGLINNLGYVMVGSASQKISERFNLTSLAPLFQFALIVLSPLIRFLNIRFFIKILHRKRVFAVIGISCISYAILSVSCALNGDQKFGFYFALIGSVFCGLMQAFGEGVILGYLKSFPSNLVGGWSSGTGLAGIAGSLIFIALNSLKVSLTITFGILIPLEFLYLFAFLWYDRKKATYQQNVLMPSSTNTDVESKDQEQQSEPQKEEISLQKNHLEGGLEIKQKSEEQLSEEQEVESLPVEDRDASGNVEFNLQSIKRVFPKLWFLCMNICLVYFFEYSCISGYANFITDRLKNQHKDKPDQDSFLIKESFEILNFCYQLGVFISRSSLSIIKVEKVWILTLIQLVNFIAYFTFSYWDYMPMGGLIPVMLFVGLMGGASYVNVMYLIINSDIIPKREKELSANIVSIFNDIGVMTASLFSLLCDNVILKGR